ncbi:MAG TPA: hypothetical protein VFA84_02940 [Acidimicrobiales bacterium]|nr:hypothetical protein [Acidimicrobiales bacterium]
MTTPVEAVLARARTRRRRRLSTTAAAAGAVVVAATLAVVGVGSGSSPSSGHGARTELVAFTVVSGPNGSTALTLRKGAQYRLDPEALRQALAQHGIPAVVNIGKMCDTPDEPSGLDEAISSRRLADGSVYTTFDPAAVPAGAEISIGYFPAFTTFSLIEDGGPLHCTTNPRAPSGTGPGGHVQPVPAGQGTNP